MLELTTKRIPFSSEATNRLAQLRSKIVIKENNILCRMGFCLSLEESGIPLAPDNLNGSPIDRYVLLGEHDKTYLALLVAWMKKNGMEDFNAKEFTDWFIAHMNRGAELISARIKNMGDFVNLLPGVLQ